VTGKFGNMLDAKASKDIMDESEDSDSNSDEEATGGGVARKGLLSKKKKEEAAICVNHSVTEPRVMRTMDRSYGYLPIDGTKPCLYTVAMVEDFRKRHLHSNILNRISDDLVGLVFTLITSSCNSVRSVSRFILSSP